MNFFETLYSGATGYLTIWTKPSQRTEWFHTDNLTAATNRAIELSNSGQTVYFGVGLGSNPKPKGRLTADEITCIPGLWFDMDIKSAAHKQTALPDYDQAVSIINQFPLEPSIIVHSGHGLHAYYLFKEPWQFESSEEREQAKSLLERFQRTIQNYGIQQGFKLDSTLDLSRVLRPPGTMNYKDDLAPADVRILTETSARYNVDDFEGILPDTVTRITEKRPSKFKRNPSDGPCQTVFDNCAFARRFLSGDMYPEPEWTAAGTNLARCSDGPEILHGLIKRALGDKYSETLTDDKIQHYLNDMHPQTCEYIQKSLLFTGCPADGCGVKSPCGFALKKKFAEPPKQKTPEPEFFSAADLEAEDIPEPTWVIPGLITTGLTFLCGKPKVGKSWLALSLALSVAYGGRAMGKIQVDKRPTLYLGLEDTKRRLKSRLELLSGGEKLPKDLILCRSIPRANEGGLEKLEEIIQQTGSRLVVVDTFQLFRRNATAKDNAYSADYQAAAEIKHLADKLDCAIVLVHHLKKAQDNDFVQSVSGSSGITGAADTIAILDRARLTGDATLKITGRDIDEQELALKKDKQTNGWTLLGDAEELKKSAERQEILMLLRRAPEGMTPTDVARELDKKMRTVQKLLSQMADDGEVSRLARGTYGAKNREEPY